MSEKEENAATTPSSATITREQIQAQWERNRCSTKSKEELRAEIMASFTLPDDSEDEKVKD